MADVVEHDLDAMQTLAVLASVGIEREIDGRGTCDECWRHDAWLFVYGGFRLCWRCVRRRETAAFGIFGRRSVV